MVEWCEKFSRDFAASFDPALGDRIPGIRKSRWTQESAPEPGIGCRRRSLGEHMDHAKRENPSFEWGTIFTSEFSFIKKNQSVSSDSNSTSLQKLFFDTFPYFWNHILGILALQRLNNA